MLRVSEVGVFRLDEYICANKNKGKYFVAFEVAEQFSTEICFVTLLFLRPVKRKVSRGLTVGKPPLHLLSVMQSVHPDGFRGKRVTRRGSHFLRILGVRKFRYVGI